MGEAFLDTAAGVLTIYSVFFFYGDAAADELSQQLANDISTCWNAPAGKVTIRNQVFTVRFSIDGIYEPGLAPEKVWYNDQPRFNFFRIEEYVNGNISFVDGVGSNTGYFKLQNVLQTPTTAAHEYGHTIGLDHPPVLDIRGKAVPGIMYPRGTICDAHFQYDPQAVPGKPGGTLNPHYRQVLQSDIDHLKLHKLFFNDRGLATIGEFSSMYHEKHVPDGF